MGMRRVVTTHDSGGKSVILIDEVVDSAFPGKIAWTTNQMPASNDGDEDAGRPTGITVPYGSVLRLSELNPGHRSQMHRTVSIGYGFFMEGECDMELDSGQTVHLQAGDVLVLRGGNHAWVNNGDKVCKVAFVNLDAKPIMIGGTAQTSTFTGT